MGPLSKKSWWQKVLLSRATLILLLLACLGLSFAVYDRHLVEREVYQRRGEAEAELVREEEREQELEKRVDYLNNEQGMEAEIRRRFDVALDGEQVVVLVGETQDDSDDVSGTMVDVERKSFWEPWWPW